MSDDPGLPGSVKALAKKAVETSPSPTQTARVETSQNGQKGISFEAESSPENPLRFRAAPHTEVRITSGHSEATLPPDAVDSKISIVPEWNTVGQHRLVIVGHRNPEKIRFEDKGKYFQFIIPGVYANEKESILLIDKRQKGEVDIDFRKESEVAVRRDQAPKNAVIRERITLWKDGQLAGPPDKLLVRIRGEAKSIVHELRGEEGARQ